MLVEAAGSVGRMKGKNYLAAQHARLTKRRGMGRAQVAVAHSILVVGLLHAAPATSPTTTSARTGTAAQRRSPHPPARRPARTARPHRGPRPGRLTEASPHSAGLPAPTLPPQPWVGYSRVCVAHRNLKVVWGYVAGEVVSRSAIDHSDRSQRSHLRSRAEEWDHAWVRADVHHDEFRATSLKAGVWPHRCRRQRAITSVTPPSNRGSAASQSPQTCGPALLKCGFVRSPFDSGRT